MTHSDGLSHQDLNCSERLAISASGGRYICCRAFCEVLFFVEQQKRKQNDSSSCDVECLMIRVSELQAQSEALNISEGLISQRTTWRRSWVMFVWVETSPLPFLLFHCARSSAHIGNTFRPDPASITPTLSLHFFSTNLASPWTSQELTSELPSGTGLPYISAADPLSPQKFVRLVL